LAVYLHVLKARDVIDSRVYGESNVGANSLVEKTFTKAEQTHRQKEPRGRKRVNKIPRQGSAAPRLRFLVRISLRFLASLVGLAVLGCLVFRAGPAAVWKQLQAVGWGVVLIIMLGGISQFVKTCSWRQAFTSDIAKLSWPRSFIAQLISDGMGQFGVAGKVFGEGMRISLLPRAVPLSSALSAGAIDAGLHSFTAVLVSVSGITATLVLAPLPAAWRAYALVLVFALLLVVIFGAVSITKRWRLVGNATRAIGKLPGLENWVSGKQPVIDSAENNLLSFHDQAPAAFWATLMLNLFWHMLAVLEVYVILTFMGARIAVGGAFVVEGLTKVINLVGALNPGNFGTYEGGNMLIAKIFGVAGTAGLTLALCRRVRTVFWAGVGGVCMLVMKRADLGQPSIGGASHSGAVLHIPGTRS
jgi:Lysylphosphatidylglycerol synthase TM region